MDFNFGVICADFLFFSLPATKMAWSVSISGTSEPAAAGVVMSKGAS